MTAQHAGDGYDDSGNARPSPDEVLDAMENGTVRRNTGRDGNTSTFAVSRSFVTI